MTSVGALFSLGGKNDFSKTLEQFIAQRLHQAGVWGSPRHSDGIATTRVLEQAPDRLRVCGRIWTIDQTQHDFWVDLDGRCGAESGTTWHLYFDVEPSSLSARRVRNAIDIIDDPTKLRWQVVLSGTESTVPVVTRV